MLLVLATVERYSLRKDCVCTLSKLLESCYQSTGALESVTGKHSPERNECYCHKYTSEMHYDVESPVINRFQNKLEFGFWILQEWPKP